MNVHQQGSRERVLQAVDTVSMKALQLHSLLAALSVACNSGDLPQDHLSNVIWLAGDLARDISEATLEVLM